MSTVILGPNPVGDRNRNLTIAVPDWSDAATWTANKSPATGTALANLTTKQPSQVAAFDLSASAVVLTGTQAARTVLDVVAVIRATATTQATIAVEIGDSVAEAEGTQAYDASGQSHHGTLVDGAAFAAGRYEGGIVLSGAVANEVSAHVAVALNDGSTEWTYMGWVCPLSVTSITLWSDGVRALRTDAGGCLTAEGVTADRPLIAGVWQHVAITQHDPLAHLTIYLDGYLVADGLGAYRDGGTIHWGSHQGTGLGMSGWMDDLRFYTTRLTQSQIASELQSETPVMALASLAVHYRCNGYQSGTRRFGVSPNLASYARRTSYLLLPYRMTATVMRVTITDPTAAVPFEIGRLFAGPVWQPSKNFSYGYTFTARDESKRTLTPSGVSLTDPRPVIHGFEYVLEHLPRTEMLANGYELRRVLGLSQECLVCLNPEESDHLESHLCYGQLTDLAVIQPQYYDGWQMRWSVEELL